MTLLILVTILMIVFLTMSLMSANKIPAQCYGKAVSLTALVLVINGVMTWFGFPS